MMMLSIVGIIWVQIVWISNAVSIRNETFNQAVIVSLNNANAASEIESSRQMDFYKNYMLVNPFSYNSMQEEVSSFVNIESYSSDSANRYRMKVTNQTYFGGADSGRLTTVNKLITIGGEPSVISDSITKVIKPDEVPEELGVLRRGQALNTNSREVYLRQNEFLNWVRNRSSELRNLDDQMISEVYRWEKTLELNNTEIAYTLRQNLAFADIHTPFEFSVIKNGAIQEGTFKKSLKNDFIRSNYMVRLFPGNLLGQDIVLSVIFPDRANYVLGSMVWLLGGSFLFSLFILATFALSLFFIIRQKKISEMKSDFINNMTHEFKTPIATISLAADTITNPKVINDETSIRHFISMIKKENSRMNKKVETILQIASLDKKEIEFNFEKVSLHTIIEHAIETIDIQVHQRNGKISLSLTAKEPFIFGDIEHLTNLVNNFLDNALKYSPVSPEIIVSTSNSDRGIVLSVADNGIGMSKSVQSKIFERFYRQSSGNVHDIKGFGLGLNYARAIVDAHKGTITVYSEPGKGSRFEIFLPFNPEN